MALKSNLATNARLSNIACRRKKSQGIKANRKGVIFFILMLLLVSMVFLSSIFLLGAAERTSIRKRVQTLNSFVLSSQEDLRRSVYISSYRGFFLLDRKVASTGVFITNVTKSFEEIFYNGTLDGVSTPLADTNYSGIILSLRKKAEPFGLNVTILNPRLIFSHTSPWIITMQLNATMTVLDDTQLVSWESNISTDVRVPIFYFEDPVFMVRTGAKITHPYTMTPYSFSESSNVSNLSAHVNGHYFKASNGGPSFLQRLSGDLSASPYGVECFVDLSELSAQGIPADDKSTIDYIYFNTSRNPTAYTISGMYPWFKIDDTDGHAAAYGVTGLLP